MTRRNRKKGTVGSTFDDFLKEDGTYESTQAVAIKRVLAWQIGQAMEKKQPTKAEIARRMDTSRSLLRVGLPAHDEGWGRRGTSGVG